MDEFDYIIVGAGSAGCALANRLSADGRSHVLLLEAGGDDSSPLIRMPKGFARLVSDPARSWHFPVEPRRGRNLPAPEVWVRGKALGGSSSINGMIYSRGQRRDYGEWEALAGPNWGWPAMRAAFKAIEDHELGEDEDRGAGGLVHVSTGKLRYPIAEAMIRAGEQMGLSRKDDLNRGESEGVGYYAHTIRSGRRVSAATAFLMPARRRHNLRVLTGVNVDRVVFDGRRATGVIGRRAGRHLEFRSRGEIILSAGTILSPKILQLSGIGPAVHLRSLGIDVTSDSPDVGARMREHVGFSMPHRLTGGKGLNAGYRGRGLFASLLQYYLFRTGPLATGLFEVGAFARSGPDVDRPDLQIYLGAYSMALSSDNFPVPLNDVDREPGLTAYGQFLRPTSEGTVLIQSSDPDAPLAIRPNFLATGHDREALVGMVRYIRRYLSQPALQPYVGAELSPGEQVKTDADILEAVQRLSISGLHGVGTCRMGLDDSAVVDARLRVRGAIGLRVVDCSIMPSPVSGNTSGPAMAVGWRAADFILEDRGGLAMDVTP